MATIGLISKDNLGSAIARRLSESGYSVVRYDLASLSPEDKSLRIDAFIQAADSARIVLIATDDSADLRRGVEFVTAFDLSETVIVNLSNISVASTLQTDERIRAAGGRCIDAAGRWESRLYVGAEVPDFDRVRPILECLSPSVTHIGPVGHGTIASLAREINEAARFVAAAEALAFVQASGVDSVRFIHALNDSPDSALFREMHDRQMSQQWGDTGHLARSATSIARAHAAADRSGLTLPMTEAMYLLFHMAEDAGFGSNETAALIKLWNADLFKPDAS